MVDSFSENNPNTTNNIENVNNSTDIEKEKSPTQYDDNNINNENKTLNVQTITIMQQEESSISCLIKNMQTGKLKYFFSIFKF